MVAPLGARVAQADEEFEGTEHWEPEVGDRKSGERKYLRSFRGHFRLHREAEPEPILILQETKWIPACAGMTSRRNRVSRSLTEVLVCRKQLRPSNAVGVH